MYVNGKMVSVEAGLVEGNEGELSSEFKHELLDVV
jgi:hypothetical protein